MIFLWWLQGTALQVGPVTTPVSWSSFWPTTAVGWISFFIAAASLLGMLYGYAKTLAALNGLGGRVDELKEEVTRERVKNEERDKIWAGMVQNMVDLTRQVQEAKQKSEQCDTNSEQYFISIGSQIADMRKAWEEAERETHGRLVGIETEMRLRNQALPLYIEKRKPV